MEPDIEQVVNRTKAKTEGNSTYLFSESIREQGPIKIGRMCLVVVMKFSDHQELREQMEI